MTDLYQNKKHFQEISILVLPIYQSKSIGPEKKSSPTYQIFTKEKSNQTIP
ncbi:hypothetical protein [Myroides pelagicus]|uniref:Uncharacterized protein n=1 Tax=Myroides pelagicus TaxID=270914 RepID=A0A7K1GKW6_9FLAO|nr:hypothetical protein [Myroides pelagicus]MEC4113668.1 hypothetical protein [Myroides pelagicus]MTH28864.1 hypothetical protein [Myroides pelagicus]